MPCNAADVSLEIQLVLVYDMYLYNFAQPQLRRGVDLFKGRLLCFDAYPSRQDRKSLAYLMLGGCTLRSARTNLRHYKAVDSNSM